MAKEAVDYAVVIRDLEQKRAALNARFDAAIGAIRQVMAMNGSEPQPRLPGIAQLPMPQPANAPYRSLGMVEAAIQHLRTVKSPVPNLKLADALDKGGFLHRSKNFPNTLNSVLWRRHKTKRDVFKGKNGWALTEWQKPVSLNPKDWISEKGIDEE